MIAAKTEILISLKIKHKELDLFTLLKPMERDWLLYTRRVYSYELNPYYISKEIDLDFIKQLNNET